MEDSIETKHAKTSATLQAHLLQCEERRKGHEEEMQRLRKWVQTHENRLIDLDGKGKIMETKIAIFAALAALFGSTFGAKLSALIGG